MVAAVCCAKDADVESPSSPSNIGEAVSFTITDDMTRALGDKTEWAAGDEIAIFVNSEETATRYVVQSDGATLAVHADYTPIKASSSAVTYTAYYPYVQDRTLSGYASLTYSTDDILKATATAGANSDAVEFSTFEHLLCGVTVNCAGMTSLSITDGSANSIFNETSISGDSYTFYHAAVSALTGYTICVNNGYYTSAETTTITKWEVGTPYTYTLYMSCDINYANGICEIYTAKGLAAFRDMANDGATDETAVEIIGAVNVAAIIFDASNSKSRIKGKLMANIDIGGESNWTPIGLYNSSDFYAGEFDGNGFEVRNLTINASAGYKGLFGYILGATIKNLGVTGSVTVSGDNYAGGVVGCANNGSKITNCYNKASVVSGCQDVGGVVGCMNDTSSTISNCYNMGTVTGSNNNVGGIVGYALSNIICCYNMGDVYSTGIDVGGVAGYCFGSTILNCFNIGDVTGSYYVGGVMGYCAFKACNIYNSYNLGSVESTNSSSNYYAGGIVGYATIGLAINNCYNAGVVSNSEGNTSQCGSIAGRTTNITASNCYYLSGSTSCTVTFTSGTTEETEATMKSSSFVTTTLDGGIGSVGQALESDGNSDYTANNWQFNYNTYPTLEGLIF